MDEADFLGQGHWWSPGATDVILESLRVCFSSGNRNLGVGAHWAVVLNQASLRQETRAEPLAESVLQSLLAFPEEPDCRRRVPDAGRPWEEEGSQAGCGRGPGGRGGGGGGWKAEPI